MRFDKRSELVTLQDMKSHQLTINEDYLKKPRIDRIFKFNKCITNNNICHYILMVLQCYNLQILI